MNLYIPRVWVTVAIALFIVGAIVSCSCNAMAVLWIVR